MLVNVYRVRANDLHKPSEHCDGKAVSCEHVVFYSEHAAAINELSSKLDSYEKMAAKLEPACYEDFAAYAAKLEQERDAALSRLDGIRKIVDSALSTEPALPGQDEVALQTIWTEYFAK
jgi:hypothetical protein